MTKKHGRAEIRFKLEHDLYDAAEEAFHEAGLSIETGLTLFLAQVAKQHIESKVVDEPHDVFATVDELMEYLEEREERRAAEKAAARQAKKNEKVLARQLKKRLRKPARRRRRLRRRRKTRKTRKTRLRSLKPGQSLRQTFGRNRSRNRRRSP